MFYGLFLTNALNTSLMTGTSMCVTWKTWGVANSRKISCTCSSYGKLKNATYFPAAEVRWQLTLRATTTGFPAERAQNFHTDEVWVAHVISMEFLRVISWGNQSRRREMSVVFSSYTKGLICWCASVIKGPLTSCLRPNAFSLSQTRAHHPGTATAGKTSLKWKVLAITPTHLLC